MSFPCCATCSRPFSCQERVGHGLPPCRLLLAYLLVDLVVPITHPKLDAFWGICNTSTPSSKSQTEQCRQHGEVQKFYRASQPRCLPLPFNFPFSRSGISRHYRYATRINSSLSQRLGQAFPDCMCLLLCHLPYLASYPSNWSFLSGRFDPIEFQDRLCYNCSQHATNEPNRKGHVRDDTLILQESYLAYWLRRAHLTLTNFSYVPKSIGQTDCIARGYPV